MGDFPSREELAERVRDLEEQLERNRRLHTDLLNYIPDLIFVKDEAHRWVVVNDAFCRALGHKRADLIGKTDYDFHPREEAETFWEKDEQVMKTGCCNVNEEVYTDAKGKLRTILTNKALYTDDKGRRLIVGIAHDITETKQAQMDREKLIAELKEALATVRTLSGLLPICAKCKKIRDDKGYWNQIESYIKQHTQADFSHGLCPECLEEIYGNQDWYKRRKKKGTE